VSKEISVVVADDHPLYRSGIIKTLQEEDGITVLGEAGTATDAVELVKIHAPDIALLDISMPGNGMTAAQEISAGENKTRIIMLTVSEQDDDIIEALKAGAVGYVLKGVGATELVSVIRDVNSGMSYVSPSLAARVLLTMKDPDSIAATPEQLLSSLSKREEEILKLVSHGLSNKEVARELDLKEKTIKHYMTNILQKLHVRNRVEAAVKAQEIWRNSP